MSKKTALILAFFAVLTLAGCAKMESIDTVKFGDESFRNWVKIHDPQAKPLTKDSMVFRRFIKHAAPDAPILEAGKYVYLNYTMSTLDGTYFISRDSLIARLTATWLKTTHWCEDYMEFYSGNGFFCQGIYDALKGLRTGDSVRLYISTSEAYKSSTISANTGYLNTQSNIYQAYPIICDVKIGSINSNPARAALDRVDIYAAEKWGQTTKDSIKSGLYMRILKKDPTGTPVKENESVTLYYKQTFMDGFLLITNSDSIAKVYNRYDEQSGDYKPITVRAKLGSGNYDAFYAYVLPKMNYGDVAEVVTIPYYTVLGNAGNFYTAPQLLTYQPTVFTILTKKRTSEDGAASPTAN